MNLVTKIAIVRDKTPFFGYTWWSLISTVRGTSIEVRVLSFASTEDQGLVSSIIFMFIPLMGKDKSAKNLG